MAPRKDPKAPRRNTVVSSVAPKLDLAQLDLRDALDLAILIEEEALDRYQEFSKVVGGRYPGDAADVFREMADNEAKHRDALVAQRKKLFARHARRIKPEMIDDVEAPDRGKPRVFMSARDAMEVALESEQKAYDFYGDALAQVKDKQVKKLFTQLQGEEKEHQSFLKKKIRRLPKGPDVEESEADEPPPM